MRVTAASWPEAYNACGDGWLQLLGGEEGGVDKVLIIPTSFFPFNVRKGGGEQLPG